MDRSIRRQSRLQPSEVRHISEQKPIAYPLRDIQPRPEAPRRPSQRQAASGCPSPATQETTRDRREDPSLIPASRPARTNPEMNSAPASERLLPQPVPPQPQSHAQAPSAGLPALEQ